MDEKEATAAFRFLIALSVRLLIASTTRSSAVELPLANAARVVFDGTVTTAAALKAQLASITPSDTEFRVAFETTHVSNARYARYYLRSLEMQAKDTADPWFVPQGDGQVINLEHVLPRKPATNWPTFSEDDLRLNVTRLGNLALMRASDNSDLRSDAFSDKREVYAASPYVLTSQIGSVEEWTVATIAERQLGLAALVVKTWPI